MLGNQDPAHGWAQQWGDSPAPPIGGGNGSWAEQPTSQKYLLTVFWAIGLISASARGDITPTTNAELVFVILCEVGGCVVFGLVLARKMLPPFRLDCLLTIFLKKHHHCRDQLDLYRHPAPRGENREGRGGAAAVLGAQRKHPEGGAVEGPAVHGARLAPRRRLQRTGPAGEAPARDGSRTAVGLNRASLSPSASGLALAEVQTLRTGGICTANSCSAFLSFAGCRSRCLRSCSSP